MRDLLKVILEKILTIPNTVSSAVVQQLLAAREVTIQILYAITIEQDRPHSFVTSEFLVAGMALFDSWYSSTAKTYSLCSNPFL